MADDSNSHPDLRARIELLRHQHQSLKAQLIELRDHPYLNAEEQIEFRTLQKMKLLKKDSLAMLLATNRGNA